MFCKYKDVLGKPRQGVHKYRIFNIAIVDVLLTLLLSAILSFIFHTHFLIVLTIVFLIGILLHYLFCVKTTIHLFLFGDKL